MDAATAIDFLNAKFASILGDALTKRKAQAERDNAVADLRTQVSSLLDHPMTAEVAEKMLQQNIADFDHSLARRIKSLRGKTAIDEASLREFERKWNPILDALETSPNSITYLRSLDSQLESASRDFVPRENRKGTHRFLEEHYGVSKLTLKNMKEAVVLPLPKGWVEFQPRKSPAPLLKIEPTAQQRALMPPSSNFPDFYSLPVQTIGELAQYYADVADFKMRLPSARMEQLCIHRNASFSKPTDLSARLRHFLENEQFNFDFKFERTVELHDVSPTKKESPDRFVPEPATQEELQAAVAAMPWSEFWNSIEAITPSANDGPGISEVALGISKSWNSSQLLGFAVRMAEAIEQLNTWEVWGVAYLINGGCSDDGFFYFRNWVISQGRACFEATVEDVQNIARWASSDQINEEESLADLPCQLYQHHLGKPMPNILVQTGTSLHPRGIAWNENNLSSLFPKVAQKFS